MFNILAEKIVDILLQYVYMQISLTMPYRMQKIYFSNIGVIIKPIPENLTEVSYPQNKIVGTE